MAAGQRHMTLFGRALTHDVAYEGVFRNAIQPGLELGWPPGCR